MRIWMFNPYGPLPDEGWREYSYVAIGSALTAAGHEVVWWTSNFSHHFKTFRSKGWEDRTLPSGMLVRLVPTPGYRRNISMGRFIRDAIFGWRAYRKAHQFQAPDVVITSEPATMLGFAGARIANKVNAILVYDQMDLWPELMVQALPRPLQKLGHFIFQPIYKCRSSIFQRLDGAMALAKPYLDSILNERVGWQEIPKIVVYNGIDVQEFRLAMEEDLPANFVEIINKSGLKAIFAGSLGPSYDIHAMIDAAKALALNNSEITIFIAGDGPERSLVENAAGECKNLIYLGKISPAVLPAIYARCDIGLSCYSAKSNVEMCDKFYDYTAAGLAILNSLMGEVKDWISDHNLGLQYYPGSAESLKNALEIIEFDREKLSVYRENSYNIAMNFDKNFQHGKIPHWISNLKNK